MRSPRISRSCTSAGAREFLVWVAPNVALTPALRTLGPAAGGLATSLTQAFNGGLDQLLGSAVIRTSRHHVRATRRLSNPRLDRRESRSVRSDHGDHGVRDTQRRAVHLQGRRYVPVLGRNPSDEGRPRDSRARGGHTFCHNTRSCGAGSPMAAGPPIRCARHLISTGLGPVEPDGARRHHAARLRRIARTGAHSAGCAETCRKGSTGSIHPELPDWRRLERRADEHGGSGMTTCQDFAHGFPNRRLDDVRPAFADGRGGHPM